MSYPLSNDVSAGQPTAASHYNNLRADSLFLGQSPTDAVPIGAFIQRYVDNIKLEYLATNRLRVPYVTTRPPTLMIGGCMCQAVANVDLPSNSFSGAAATWYIFARRSPGSSAFTLEVNTSNAETTSTRLIGEVNWDGSNLNPGSLKVYTGVLLPNADYDSGWFSVASNTLYTKAHNLGQPPRLFTLFHSAVSAPGSGDELVRVTVVTHSGGIMDVVGTDGTNIYVKTGYDGAYGTSYSTRRYSGAGYYRVQAWR